MIHEAIGDWGHLFVIIAFVAALISTIGYIYTASAELKGNSADIRDLQSWKNFSRISFYVHGFAVFGIIICLYSIIYNNYFEYHYAWSHSSRDLPWYYMISCFWEGQEGSFLLWIFWQVLLGLVLIKVNKLWEAPVLAVFCLVQAFLTSMILGASVPEIDLRIGSSPFILLKDFMGDIPVYKTNPNYVPENGTGLNLLLQNYWMVIHPPTLFLGFAATLVPFSFCIAGLWMGKYKEWIKPALPWNLFAALVLGVGILMGGYWAYETLNFGGYWNWDPVENAVFVPWLVLIGSIHTMISYRNSNTALKASIILVITTFLLILYSTYLTRSGVLGESSVHSFTDLGLKNQLFLYVGTFALIALVLCIIAWKKIPSSEKEVNVYSREFWIFIGVTVLCLSAFQIIIPTSIPFFNVILKSFGIKSNMAPPAQQEVFYSNWQIWFAMAVAILSGIGQFFWWKKMDRKKFQDALFLPLITSLLISIFMMIMFDSEMDERLRSVYKATSRVDFFGILDKPVEMYLQYFGVKVKYILFWTAGIFTIVANGKILVNLFRSNYKLSGGAVTHIGFGLMLLGILFSSGYSKVISLNTSGLLYSKSADNEFNTENILLWRNDPAVMGEYELTYKGNRLEAKGFPGYVDVQKVFPIDEANKVIATEDLLFEGEKYFSRGDTLEIHPENTYYEVEYRKKDSSDVFTLFPRIQANEQMGKVVSPDIKRFLTRDFYTHITSFVEEKDREWTPEKELKARVGDTVFINDYVGVLKSVEKETFVPGVTLGPNDAAIKAHFVLFGKNGTYDLYPKYIIKIAGEGENQEVVLGQIPQTVPELGLRLTFLNIDPATETFTFSESTTQKDFIILKVVEKPLINLLWIGTFVLVIGLCMAIARRYSEFKKVRDKEEVLTEA
jgi:cytochrome c-type biogenesis protein CcmF